jgi:Leucine-rich repeat (LRR) protein
VNLSGSTAIEELRLDDSNFSAGIPDISDLENLRIIDLDQCNISGSIDLSNLSSLVRIDVSGNTALTEVIISSSQPLGDDEDVNFSNCALTETTVNNILVALANNAINDSRVNLSGGTNAVPTGAGLTAITTLEGKGWEVNVNAPLAPFDVTADWSLTSPAVVDEASFRTFLESGEDGDGNTNSLTDVVITDFSLISGRLTCNLSADGDLRYLQLSYMDITSVISLGNITGTLNQLRLNDNNITSVDNITWPSVLQLYLYTNSITSFNPTVALPSGLQELDLGINQIVNFNPSLPLPSSITNLWLNSNQMTTAGYTASEPWANAMSVIPGRGIVYFIGNVNSVSGTNLETILISKGWTVIA